MMEEEESYGFEETLMYGQFTTTQLQKYAKEQGARLRREQQQRREEQQQAEDDLKTYDDSCLASIKRLIAWSRPCWSLLGSDWVFLLILGIIMALISSVLDLAIEKCQTAHIWLFSLPSNTFLQYLVWTSFPLILITFSVGFTYLVSPHAIGGVDATIAKHYFVTYSRWRRNSLQSRDFWRPIKGICGLTGEIVVCLVVNLDTRQQCREEYSKRDLPPEHPRASSTDDVEGIIALFHEVTGVFFDTKEFYEFPKIMNEFSKKSDPNLPFYYWTGSQTCYRNFPLPSFNEPSKEGVERLDRVTLSRRGDPGVVIANRASLPQRNQLTVRANFHRAPVPLPPVEFDRAS